MTKDQLLDMWARAEGKEKIFFHTHFKKWLDEQPDTPPEGKNDTESDGSPKKGTRTDTQNKAMWKQHQLVADELTKLGVTMRKVFEATTDFDIPPTKDNVHDLWLYFQRIMYPSMPSSRDLPKHGDHYQKIHDVMMKNLGEKFHADYIDFPNDETKGKDKLQGITKARELDYPIDPYEGQKVADFGEDVIN